MVKMRNPVLRAKAVAERCMVRVALDVKRLDKRRVTSRVASGSCGCSAFVTLSYVRSVENALNVSRLILNPGDELEKLVVAKRLTSFFLQLFLNLVCFTCDSGVCYERVRGS